MVAITDPFLDLTSYGKYYQGPSQRNIYVLYGKQSSVTGTKGMPKRSKGHQGPRTVSGSETKILMTDLDRHQKAYNILLYWWIL